MRLGQTLLLTGEFAEGWEEYEWRYQIPGAQPLMPKTDKPQWNGAPLRDDQRCCWSPTRASATWSCSRATCRGR